MSVRCPQVVDSFMMFSVVKKQMFFSANPLFQTFGAWHFRWSVWWSPCIYAFRPRKWPFINWWKKFYECQWWRFSRWLRGPLLIGSARSSAGVILREHWRHGAHLHTWNELTCTLEWLHGVGNKDTFRGAIRPPSGRMFVIIPSGRSWVGLCMEHSKRAVRRGPSMEVMKICK